MDEIKKCRTCGSKLEIRATKKNASQLNKEYYYKAYYYCLLCKKIYHDEKFKVINNCRGLFDTSSNDLNRQQAPTDYDVQIWTDGACVNNGRANARAAWAFVSGAVEKSGLVKGDKQTNNVAEGLAILEAIAWAADNNKKRVKLHTDSQISLFNLRKPARFVKENKEIFLKIESIINKFQLEVVFEKVVGHADDINNIRADNLANTLARGG